MIGSHQFTSLISSQLSKQQSQHFANMEYAEFCEFVGPCEGWPNSILDAFVEEISSDSLKKIVKFAYDHSVPSDVLCEVLKNLPCGSASEDYIQFAAGLYEMWAASGEGEEEIRPIHEEEEPGPSALPSECAPAAAPATAPAAAPATSPATDDVHAPDLQWCLVLEQFAGPMKNWPLEVLHALKANQCEATARTIASWGYFQSIQLDILTDVLHAQPGCTGDPALLLIMVQIYDDLYSEDNALAIALSSANEGIEEIEDNGEVTSKSPSKSPSPPALTIVELTQDVSQDDSLQVSQPLSFGPDLSRPEVLGRLGVQYVKALLARDISDPFLLSWSSLLNFLGPPKEWPLDIRRAFDGTVTTNNLLTLATFGFMNGVPHNVLLEYLLSRPQGIDSQCADKLQLYYAMWQNPTRGKFYRSQRFAYCLKLKRYLDLNYNESSSAIARRLNKSLLQNC